LPNFQNISAAWAADYQGLHGSSVSHAGTSNDDATRSVIGRKAAKVCSFKIEASPPVYTFTNKKLGFLVSSVAIRGSWSFLSFNS
jgi:hypothetical protein